MFRAGTRTGSHLLAPTAARTHSSISQYSYCYCGSDARLRINQPSVGRVIAEDDGVEEMMQPCLIHLHAISLALRGKGTFKEMNSHV